MTPDERKVKRLFGKWRKVAQAKAGASDDQLHEFFRRVAVDHVTGCWTWTGSQSNGGHTPIFPQCPKGPARPKATLPLANRVSFLWFRGVLMPWPHWKVVRTCGNDLCVAPEHLRQARTEGRGDYNIRPTTDMLTAFFAQVAVPYERGAGCWLWTGPISHGGYGQFTIGENKRCAHLVVYSWFVQSVAEFAKDIQLDHTCRARHCVNPMHLEPVTRYENMVRRRDERKQDDVVQEIMRDTSAVDQPSE